MVHEAKGEKRDDDTNDDIDGIPVFLLSLWRIISFSGSLRRN
jgi:hypothetical protein